MFEWVGIAIVVIGSVVIWASAPQPANYVLGGLGLLVSAGCVIAMVKGLNWAAIVLIVYGLLVVAVEPTYGWGVKPLVSASHLWSRFGMLSFALLCLVVAPLLGVLSSMLLATPPWRVVGLSIVLVPTLLALLGGVVYVITYLSSFPASRRTAQQHQIMALGVIPGMLTFGVCVGVVLHRMRLGELKLG